MKSRTKAPNAPTRTLTRGNEQVPQNGFWRSSPASVWNESAEIRDFFNQTPNAGFRFLLTADGDHVRELAFRALGRLVSVIVTSFQMVRYQTQTKRYQTLNGQVTEINKILGVYVWSGCGSVAAGHATAVGGYNGGQAGLVSGATPSFQPPKSRTALGNLLISARNLFFPAILMGFRAKRDLRRWKKFYRPPPADGVRFFNPDHLKILEHLSINNMPYNFNTLKLLQSFDFTITICTFRVMHG